MLNDKKDILALTGDGIVFFRMRSARFINSTIGFQLYRPPGYWVFSCVAMLTDRQLSFSLNIAPMKTSTRASL